MSSDIKINHDREHLHMLAIFYYVFAALEGLFGCIPFLELVIGVALLGGVFDHVAKPPPPNEVLTMGLLTGSVGLIGVVYFWGMTIVQLLCGICLHRQRSLTFCIVAAGLELLNTPLGTVLGVCTIVVLIRPGVKALFDGEPLREPEMEDDDEAENPPISIPQATPPYGRSGTGSTTDFSEQ